MSSVIVLSTGPPDHVSTLSGPGSRPNLGTPTLVPAREVGVLKGRARVLDSTALYDAVATQDTVTQLRAAIRKVLATVPPGLTTQIRSALRRDDDYATIGKPPCDWDDSAAREASSTPWSATPTSRWPASTATCSTALRPRPLRCWPSSPAKNVAAGEAWTFRIVRGEAKDRTISTVDPQARHGHKSQNRRFDGYKTHLSIDPDSELIAAATATPGNTPDRHAIEDLPAQPGVDPEGPGGTIDGI